jgi:alcohol dehydrogenase (cytochrome c)
LVSFPAATSDFFAANFGTWSVSEADKVLTQRYFQYTPGDMWDYDEVGTHILFERVIDGERRKLVTHSARNGFVYTMDRHNGAMVGAQPYVDNVNWTKGIDQKSGKPLE